VKKPILVKAASTKANRLSGPSAANSNGGGGKACNAIGGNLKVPMIITFGKPETQKQFLRNEKDTGEGEISVVEMKPIGKDAGEFGVAPEKVGGCLGIKEKTECKIEVTFKAGAAEEFNEACIEYTTNVGGPYFSELLAKR
jgi:hypothetical protein